MKVECPRCHTHVEKPASGSPICPTCGFGAPGSGTEGAPVIEESAHLDTARPNYAPHQSSTGIGSAQGAGSSWSAPAPGGMAAEPAKGMAITALVLGIVGFLTVWIFGIGLLLDVVAIVLGSIAAVQAKKKPELYGGRGMAITGAIVGALSIVLTILAVIVFIATAGGLQEFVDEYCADNPDDPNCQELESAGMTAGMTAAQPVGLSFMAALAVPTTTKAWARGH